jgi:hypothetical protein
MNKKELLEKIEDLERRVKELEARPPVVITIPAVPYQPPQFPWLPQIWCGQGTSSGKIDTAITGTNAPHSASYC